MVRFFVMLSTLFLLTFCLTSLLRGQTEEQGEILLREARTMQESARTREDFESAAQKFREALSAFEIVRNERGIGEANLQLGRLYLNHLRMFQLAGTCFEKSLDAFAKTGDMKGRAAALNGLGVVCWHMSRYDKAIEYYEEALHLFKALGDPAGEAGAVGNLAMIHELRGQHERAAEYYGKSLEIFRRVGDRAGESRMLINLGAAYKNLGRYAKAVQCYERSLEIKRELGDRRGEGNTLLGLAIVFGNWIDHAKSAEYAEKALDLFREIHDQSGEATALISLGMTYRDWGRYSTATKYLETALTMTGQIGDRRNESVALAALGKTQAHLGELSDALVSYQESLALCKEIGLPTDFSLNRIADLYLSMGQIDKAEPFVMEAGYTATLARFYLLKGQYEMAKGYYEKLIVSRHTGKERSEDNRYAGYTGLGMAYEGMGDFSAAAEYYRKAVRHTEELRSTVPQAQRHSFFQVRIEGFFRTAPYEGLSRVLLRLNRPLEAFKGSEYTKARVFAEAMSRSSDSVAFDIPPDILKSDR